MQTGIAHMFISTEDLEWQSELDHANRAFAAMIGGQRYENITHEEAKRLRQPLQQGAADDTRKAPAEAGAS